MERALGGDGDAPAGVKPGERRALDHDRVADAGPAQRRELVGEDLFVLLGTAKQETRDALEVAVESFLADDRLDPVDGGQGAPRGQTRVVLAMNAFDLG